MIETLEDLYHKYKTQVPPELKKIIYLSTLGMFFYLGTLYSQ